MSEKIVNWELSPEEIAINCAIESAIASESQFKVQDYVYEDEFWCLFPLGLGLAFAAFSALDDFTINGARLIQRNALASVTVSEDADFVKNILLLERYTWRNPIVDHLDLSEGVELLRSLAALTANGNRSRLQSRPAM